MQRRVVKAGRKLRFKLIRGSLWKFAQPAMIDSFTVSANDIVGAGPIQTISVVLGLIVDVAKRIQLYLGLSQIERPRRYIQNRIFGKNRPCVDRTVHNHIDVGA